MNEPTNERTNDGNEPKRKIALVPKKRNEINGRREKCNLPMISRRCTFIESPIKSKRTKKVIIIRSCSGQLRLNAIDERIDWVTDYSQSEHLFRNSTIYSIWSCSWRKTISFDAHSLSYSTFCISVLSLSVSHSSTLHSSSARCAGSICSLLVCWVYYCVYTFIMGIRLHPQHTNVERPRLITHSYIECVYILGSCGVTEQIGQTTVNTINDCTKYLRAET